MADQLKAYMPAIRNGVLMVLASKTSQELLTRKGKEKLADEIMREAVRPLGIELASEDDEEAKGEKAIQALRDHVSHEIGPIAKPRQIMVVPELPKTRSGKIMRRLLRDVAEHREIGDVTTLADSSVMEMISEGLNKGGSEE